MSIPKINTILVFFIVITSIQSCKEEVKKVDVSNIDSDVKVTRFDEIFAHADTQTLPEIKAEFPLFFPDTHTDEEWLTYKNDTVFQDLYRDSEKVFGNFKKQKEELDDLFKHVKYYYPHFKEPQVITLISNLDLENQVIYTDSLLLISLDTYLGSKQMYYTDTPDYLKKRFEPQHFILDVASVIAKETAPKIPYSVFIERIVALGKIKYAMQCYLPEKTEAELMDYNPEQLEWAQNNEYYMWQYFMEKEYIYNSDRDLERRFIDPAPFSKFYIESDAESPGQIGIWLGLQIVKSYMQYNEVTLPEMMATPPMDIFNKSKYKPSK